MNLARIFLFLYAVGIAFGEPDPTEVRDWHATGGHTARGSAVAVSNGRVSLKLENDKVVQVPLERLEQADRDFLAAHFRTDTTPPKAPESAPADDLPHPLGRTTGEIDTGKNAHYFLYLPKSLVKGEEHPVIFVMNPGGGGPDTANLYIPGAERNGWIIAVSKESKNGFEGSGAAVLEMVAHVRKTLPIDKKRMYASGFSGGARMCFWLSQKESEIAGLIPCGAGGVVGSTRQAVYGLCGSNCFNRTDMAKSFAPLRSKGSILRFFEGRHEWGTAELIEDAMTHLNGEFLSDSLTSHAKSHARYNTAVGELIQAAEATNATRAYMWAKFMTTHGFKHPAAGKAMANLAKDPKNNLYLEGLQDIGKFAEKKFVPLPTTQWKADPTVASACQREAKKYAGTVWEAVLNKMAEDAQSF